MKLDKRIENERLIFTPFTAIKPKLHEKGYFTDDIHAFNNLEECDCRYGELVEHDSSGYAYPYCGESDDTVDWYAFYIPESSLKPKEKQKQYRPYTLNEFLKEIPMHTVITMRKKVDNDCIVTCTFTGYRTRCICTDVCLGVEWISLGTLADEYEYKNTYIGNWKPFGVEE